MGRRPISFDNIPRLHNSSTPRPQNSRTVGGLVFAILNVIIPNPKIFNLFEYR